MTRIGIYGVCGKMGKRIADLSFRAGDMGIAYAIEKDDHPMIGKDLAEALGGKRFGIDIISVSDFDRRAPSGVDCMIDFTAPEALAGHVKTCLSGGIPMVIGTTGMAGEADEIIKKASGRLAIVFSPNMSVGVNLLFKLASSAAGVLGRDFNIRLDETHHVHKKDSPSGTAKMIVRVIKEACGREVPVEAFREGEIVGNHGIIFEDEYETLEIRHNAKSRDVFAAGAIKAARFVAGREPGLYTMADVLGL